MERPDTGLRIGFLVANQALGGVQSVVATLANALAERGYRVDLVLLNADGLDPSRISPRVRVHDLGKPRALKAAIPLARYLHSRRPDVLFSAQVQLNGLAALVRTAMPWLATKLVLTEHTVLSCRADFGPLQRLAVMALYPLGDRVTGVSKDVTADLTKLARLRPDRVLTIHNPVVARDFPARLQAEIEDPWLKESGAPVIVTSGRLEPVKDQACLLRAFAALLETMPARLLILGEGSLRSGLEELARGLGIRHEVRFAGRVDNPLAYLRRCDLFALTSSCEGFGNAIVEALYAGLPVVATDCPGGPREILSDGAFGTLVAPGDHVGFATAMARALTAVHDSEALSRRALDFAAEGIVDHVETLISQLLGTAVNEKPMAVPDRLAPSR